MVLTLERAIRIVEHAGYSDTSVPPLEIVDEAANRMLLMHPWRCTVHAPIQVGVRAPITLTGATWSYTSPTYLRKITKTNAFTNYTHAPGDTITITGGTGAVLRDYTVQEKLSVSEIIVTEDIGATHSSTDIAGTLNANRAVVMPSDFGRGLVAYSATSSLSNQLRLVGQLQLLELRTSSTVQPVGQYYGSLFQANNVSTAGGSPALRLELWPYPTAADPKLFVIGYHVGWVLPTVDSAILPIPTILEPLFVACLRAVTRGWEEEEQGSVEDHMDRLRNSSLFVDTTTADGLMMPDLGPLTHGNENPYMEGWMPFPTTYIADP